MTAPSGHDQALLAQPRAIDRVRAAARTRSRPGTRGAVAGTAAATGNGRSASRRERLVLRLGAAGPRRIGSAQRARPGRGLRTRSVGGGARSCGTGAGANPSSRTRPRRARTASRRGRPAFGQRDLALFGHPAPHATMPRWTNSTASSTTNSPPSAAAAGVEQLHALAPRSARAASVSVVRDRAEHRQVERPLELAGGGEGASAAGRARRPRRRRRRGRGTAPRTAAAAGWAPPGTRGVVGGSTTSNLIALRSVSTWPRRRSSSRSCSSLSYCLRSTS